MVEGDGWSLQAVATPGHASNHMAFAWREQKILFSGDHVMGWSTSIVSPPDGSMIDYMASLEKLLHRDEELYFCGHGPQIPDAKRYVRFLQRHRKAREESILHRLAKGPCDIPTIVRASYIGIDPRLVQRGRPLGVRASGGSGGAQGGGDRRRAVDRRHLSLGRRPWPERPWPASCCFFCAGLALSVSVVDVFDQLGDARGVAAEIMVEVARR